MKAFGLHMFNASEFSLTIALVVFVMITIFLIAILVLLCVSKNFRVFFFRENREQKSDEEVPPEPEKNPDASDKRIEPEIRQKPDETPAAKKPRKKSSETFGVPTVPLTLATPAPKSHAKKKSDDAVWNNGEIAAQSDKTTYTTRSAPIASKQRDKNR